MTTISSIDARFAQDQVGIASRGVTASIQNLVSGQKADANVADLSVGTVLATRVGTLRVTVSNAGQAKSLLETAKGALNTILSLLQKQKNLAVKAADDSLSDNERGFLNQEFQAIVSEVDRIAGSANFNGKKLLDGSIDGTGASIANADTTTGLADEEYSLINARDISTSGTLATGSLKSSHAVTASNVLYFGAGGGADDTITFTIDSDLLTAAAGGAAGGKTAAQSITYDITTTTTAVQHAAAFVAAAQASTNTNFQQFSYYDNLDGSVTVTAKEAGSKFNKYGFSADNATNTATLKIGRTSGAAVSLEGATQASEQTFDVQASTATTDLSIAGVDGLFEAVTANNVADTYTTGLLAFGADSATGAASINGTKNVKTLTLNDALTAGETVIFLGVTFLVDADPDAADEFAFGATAADTAIQLANALNANATTSAQYVYTTAGADVIATAKYFNNGSGTAQSALNVLNFTGSGNFTEVETTTGVDVSTAAAPTLTIADGSGNTISTTTLSLAINTGTTFLTGTQIATRIADYLNSNANPASRLFSFVDNADGTITFTAREKNLDINSYKFTFADDILTLASATVGGNTFLGAAKGLNATGSTVTLATTRSISVNDLTTDSRLIGEISDLQGTFNYHVDSNNNNTVQLSAVINGVTYTSNQIYLQGSSTTATGSDTIKAGTKIIFSSPTGPTDSNGAFTNNSFQFTVGSSDITLASVSSSSTGQNSLTTVVDALQTQLDSVIIDQQRSLAFDETDATNSDHTIVNADGTILEGLNGFDAIGTDRLSFNAGDVTLTSNLFASDGTHGRIGQFSIDSVADTITTTIDGETFIAYLNSGTAPTTGGVEVYGTDANGNDNNGSYNTTTKILTIGNGTGGYGKLNFYSEGITDGRILTIDLKNVYAAGTTTIDLSTEDNQTIFTDALNTLFGASTSDSSTDSLSFQVGVESTDTISVTIGSALTDALYQDDDGVAQVIDVATRDAAITAGEILDNAINNVISLVSTVSASITSFDSSIQNNQASIQNADAARSKLLDTDYTAESTRFAETRVRVDAATAVLAQVNTRIQNLLSLLQQ